jgi:hypothetical protein
MQTNFTASRKLRCDNSLFFWCFPHLTSSCLILSHLVSFFFFPLRSSDRWSIEWPLRNGKTDYWRDGEYKVIKTRSLPRMSWRSNRTQVVPDNWVVGKKVADRQDRVFIVSSSPSPCHAVSRGKTRPATSTSPEYRVKSSNEIETQRQRTNVTFSKDLL